MTPSPNTVGPDALSATSLELANSLSITSVFVIEDGRPVGIVHLHDLLRIGAA